MDENKKTEEVLVYSCGYCGKLYRNKESADLCHSDRTCSECGVVIGKRDYYTICDKCRRKKEFKKILEQFEKAEKLTPEEYDEKYPNHMFVLNEDTFYDIDDIYWVFNDYEIEDIPDFVWGTESVIISLCADNIIEDHEERAELDDYELDKEASNSIVKFCEEWNKKYATTAYTSTTKVAIILDKNKIKEN